ncbi:MAG TPA: alpha/beta hydrolase [Ottowia sp.]|uniref:alpha/beta hydrolase n=1 Tax=Ottowia sp. TaxID=1898956 RepID=UPI002BC970EB|nr:alpha/beta hydrolase [Ottowia sp.]HMN20748.1 alpha/beta hydrolase [Ottowia sp.]
MSSIVFSHGNSFPASTYRVLLDSLRARGFTVHAIEKFGHDPKYPVTDNWTRLERQLAHFAAQRKKEAGGALPWLVGHSMGGILSLMCAARHPELARGVVMLDSPVLSGWRAGAVRMAKRTPLMRRLSPSAVALRRRKEWDDRQAVYEHFRAKKLFAAWDPQVLRDYVNHGTIDAEGTWRLAFDPEVESRIYETLPHNLDRLLRKHPLQRPVAFIGGISSVEMRQMGGLDATAELTQGRVTMIEGTHLIPMEQPLATAAAIEAHIRAMASAAVTRAAAAPETPG